MIPSIFALLVPFVGSLLLITAPVFATTLYTWRTADGNRVFTDNPRGAPSDVQIHVWAERSVEQVPLAPQSAADAIDTLPTVEQASDGVTQGDFAVQLVEELGLEDQPDEERARNVLTKIRIAPRLGRWELDEPMTPELMERLRSLTAASAVEGWITLTPEEGLLAFDTTAALLGVTIPELAETDRRSDEANQSIDETPPLVYVNSPPPGVYPYYLWQPVDGGYWWNGAFVSGVYILDFDRYSARHHRHGYEHQHRPDGHTAMTPDRIGHHLRSRTATNHPEFRAAARPHRPPRVAGAPGFRRTQERPPVPPVSSAGIHNRAARSSGLSRAPDLAATREVLRKYRPGVRSVDTPAVPSARAAVSTDGASKSIERRGGAARGRSPGPGFVSR